MSAAWRRFLVAVVVVCGLFNATWLATAALQEPPDPASLPPLAEAPVPSPFPMDPRLGTDHPAHDYGVVLQGRRSEHIFELRNQTDVPTRITEVKASCGCTATTLSSPRVPAGGAVQLRVTFAAGGARGRFGKTVQVFSDSPRSPLVLRVSGTVVPLFRVEPEMVLFGRVAPGRTRRHGVRIVAASPEVRMVCAAPRIDGLAVRVENLRQRSPGLWTVDLVACPQGPTDRLEGAVRVPTGNGEAPYASIRVSGDVEGGP